MLTAPYGKTINKARTHIYVLRAQMQGMIHLGRVDKTEKMALVSAGESFLLTSQVSTFFYEYAS